MKKILFILCALLVLSLAPAHTSFALDVPSAGSGSNPPAAGSGSNPAPAVEIIPTLGNPLKVDSLQDLLLKVADLLIFIGIIVAVLMFIFIGFKFVWAQGNDSELTEAKKWFLYCVIGTAILLSSKVIVEVVKNTLTAAGVVDKNQFTQQK
jgi:hypothetical protein